MTKKENIKTDKKYLLLTVILLLVLFIVYTLLVKYYNVRPIGPEDSKVGFAALNKEIHELLGYNEVFYNITKYLGIIPFLIVIFYGVIGLKQFINKKSLLKVDRKLLFLGFFYILIGLVYILFEHLVINYRPVILDEGLEASYPSSHTILAITICLSSLLISKYFIKNKKLLKIFNILTIILMIILVVGRFLSGVHWTTDIIGGIILSITLFYIYYLSIYNFLKKK